MKRLAAIALFFILLGFAGQDIHAQTLKFGHINSDELIQALPEFDSANVAQATRDVGFLFGQQRERSSL